FCRQTRAVPWSKGPNVSQSELIPTELVSMLTNSDLVGCQSPLLANLEKNHLALAVIHHPTPLIRAARHPFFRGRRFLRVVSANKEIMRVGRELSNAAHILKGRLQVKKHRLIMWIYDVKCLARYYVVNRCCCLCYL